MLFAELLKQTPVCDCPDSHIEIENVLVRVREATSEINKATDDPRMKIIMERTWLLQDRLLFDDMVEDFSRPCCDPMLMPSKPDARSASSIRALGHVQLCGVLHVCWQTKGGVDGQYLICLLYRDFLLLASAPKTDRAEQAYAVQACIGLSELRVEETDNGKGKLLNPKDVIRALIPTKVYNATQHHLPGKLYLSVIISFTKSQ